MRNRQKDFMFSYLISGFEKSMQSTLNMMYARSNMIDEENHRREMEQMKQEITEDVLARVSIWIEDEAIKQLRDLLNDLGR